MKVDPIEERKLMQESKGDAIAIVGGSGYLGCSLAKHLSKRFRVSILDPLPPQDFDGNFTHCDIRDRQTLKESLKGFDLAINTAIIQLPRINEMKREAYEVNVLGVQNLCETVEATSSIKGLLHTSSWHVFGERDLSGVLDEESGFRPDNTEDRARLYALCKITQEGIIRIISEMSSKSYGILRVGTMLGEQMPKQTAASIFIDNAIKGQPITPYRHAQHRPMLYVDIQDVCKAFETFATMILANDSNLQGSKATIVNLVWPRPVTIIELARIVHTQIMLLDQAKTKSQIEIIDNGIPPIYTPQDKSRIKIDITKARKLLGLSKLITPKQSIKRILSNRLSTSRQGRFCRSLQIHREVRRLIV
jgi:nucleoside-diphosphate-sugar epimerase